MKSVSVEVGVCADGDAEAAAVIDPSILLLCVC
jgi:hypothetical protein